MNSGRTADFGLSVHESGLAESSTFDDEKFIFKAMTTPMTKINANFKTFQMPDIEASDYSFKNDLMSKRTFAFLKSKDKCLQEMYLSDEIIQENEEEDDNKEKDKKNQKEIKK